MSTIFAVTLAAHVILGIIGLIASFATMLNLWSRTSSLRRRRTWAWTACGAYVTSWLAGGYYYVFYYGGVVKPIIKDGAYPWGHLVFMEFKEHAFLFLPFATAALAIAVAKIDEQADGRAFGQVKLLSALITLTALIVTLSGVLITGSASG